MHKKLVNYCTIELKLIPDGPILIKSGREGADPTKPDMEFVETYHKGKQTIYLPGSSLKGAIRAHAERIVRTVGSDKRPTNDSFPQLWASNLLDDKDKENNPNLYLEEWKNQEKKKKLDERHRNPGAELYKQSCFVSQIFGNTCIASRLRIEDAYPCSESALKLEQRNGVAIDRVFGSVAVGPFNYQVCTEGKFIAKIHLKNFTLAQLGLIGLVLRDLDEGWFGIGFAKSRGLGTIKVELTSASVQYPGCILKDGQIHALGSKKYWSVNKLLGKLLGVGEFLSKEECNLYNFSHEDAQIAEIQFQEMTYGLGVCVKLDGESAVKNLFSSAVLAWKRATEKASV